MLMWARESRTNPEVSCKVHASFEAPLVFKQEVVTVLYLQRSEGGYIILPEVPGNSEFQGSQCIYQHSPSQVTESQSLPVRSLILA